MHIINTTPHVDGGFNVIQSWDEKYPVPAGFAVVPETVDTTTYYEHNGFVFLSTTIIDGVETVTGFTPNVESWEAWKATQPVEPTKVEPTMEERMTAMENAIKEGLAL